MKRWLRALFAAGVAVVTAAGLGLVVTFGAPHAKAASLVQVTNFGADPSNNLMYIYVPNNVKPNPPILMALHQCTGTGPGFFSSTAFASLADQYGFIVIYPDANRSGQCWDVSSTQALTRNGGSDPVGLMSMITYAEQHYGGNPSQVYITGASSGAMMTNVMLADYPDVFKAGVAFMGVPYHCFFTGTVDGWNSACANGQVSMTGAQWGDLVRNTADPGYSGARPRMEVWHGTADTTLNYNNFGQEILQWTNVLGVSSTPTTTTQPQSGWTETTYGGSGAMPPVEGISISGVGHVLPIEGEGMEADAIAFMGLNNSTQGNTVTVTNPGTQTTTIGSAASVQIHATDSGGATLTYSATGLPAGLSINSSTGLISGTPTTIGTSSVTVTAKDSTGASGSASFTWTIVTAGTNTVTVTNPGSQSSTVGTAVSVQIHATDSGGAALTYSATGLPAGLSINSSTGLISGTPTTAATSSVTVTATDTTGATGSASFTWTVGSGGGGGSCKVVYTTNSQWPGGFTAQVVISNTGSSAISSWNLGFTFPGDQKLTSDYNGTFSQSAEAVTLTNASYNGSIAAGGSVTVGFQGTWTNSDAAPTAFTLNGATCAT
jgi:poly(hydroxyalkanoate) depolymerase family esterase